MLATARSTDNCLGGDGDILSALEMSNGTGVMYALHIGRVSRHRQILRLSRKRCGLIWCSPAARPSASASLTLAGPYRRSVLLHTAHSRTPAHAAFQSTLLRCPAPRAGRETCSLWLVSSQSRLTAKQRCRAVVAAGLGGLPAQRQRNALAPIRPLSCAASSSRRFADEAAEVALWVTASAKNSSQVSQS